MAIENKERLGMYFSWPVPTILLRVLFNKDSEQEIVDSCFDTWDVSLASDWKLQVPQRIHKNLEMLIIAFLPSLCKPLQAISKRIHFLYKKHRASALQNILFFRKCATIDIYHSMILLWYLTAISGEARISSWTGFNHGQILIETATHSLIWPASLLLFMLVSVTDCRDVRVRIEKVEMTSQVISFHRITTGYWGAITEAVSN